MSADRGVQVICCRLGVVDSVDFCIAFGSSEDLAAGAESGSRE